MRVPRRIGGRLLLDAHRMLEFQSAALQQFDTYQKLFRDAFPDEAAQSDAAGGDLDLLINDITVLRATATFLRTTVTRDTPWDRFLAGDNAALTPAQRRGAKLFFTSATANGAGCHTCHSGPMLNKQVNDPDVAGIGQAEQSRAERSDLPRRWPARDHDPLSRRDMGLEFLNVSARVGVALIDAGRGSGGQERRVYRLTNNGTSPVDTHLLVIPAGLSAHVEMTNASGRTSAGDPYLRVFLPNGVLAPGESTDVTLQFRRHGPARPVSFTLTLLSGQGTP